jgi:hypothetical protein
LDGFPVDAFAPSRSCSFQHKSIYRKVFAGIQQFFSPVLYDSCPVKVRTGFFIVQTDIYIIIIDLVYNFGI